MLNGANADSFYEEHAPDKAPMLGAVVLKHTLLLPGLTLCT